MGNFTILPFVKTKDILKQLNAKVFFETYLSHIKMVKHKMRGKDGNGKAIDFSEDEKRQIVEALQKFAADSANLLPTPPQQD